MTAHDCDVVPFPDSVDLNKLAFEVPNTRKPGQTGNWRNATWPELITPDNQPIKTVQDLWAAGLAKDPKAPCLGWRRVLSTNPLVLDNKYSWLSYGEVDQRARNLGSTLHRWFENGKLTKAEGDLKTVGIWSINRPEWQITAIATQNYGLVSVSLYDTLGPDSVQFIMNHSQLSIIFCTVDKIPQVLRLAPHLSSLKVIVSIDDLSDATRPLLQAWGKDRGVEIAEMKDLEAFGKKHPHDLTPILSTQVATICYTSGTTGNPKGALITHGALAVSTIANLHGNPFYKGGPLLSYLPLAHIFARFIELLSFSMGVPVGYYSGDILRLLEDAQTLKPVYFISVPRVLNRIYAGASATLAGGGLKATLLQKAIDAKLQLLHTTGSTDHLLWDRLVFRKLRALLGGNVKLVASGSAPISPDVLNFLKIAFGGTVIEGYGMTETCGACLRGYGMDNRSAGTCGPPQPCNEVKLIDVPEMGYTSLDKPYPRGELCTRGYNNMIGYYKDPENTKKALDADGWLHSGDVASIDSTGRVSIIDRVKNIMKLSQGEYVALEKIENTYSSVGLLANTFVYGDSLRDHLVAIVVPDPVALVELAQRLSIASDVKPTDIAALDRLVADPRIYNEIMGAMNAAAKTAGLKGFETVKRVHISNELFTADNGMLTPTFKLKRKEATIKYRKELDNLYVSSL